MHILYIGFIDGSKDKIMAGLIIPLLPDGSKIIVAIPSDIAIIVTSVIDVNGNEVPLDRNYLKFVFKDSDGTEVVCLHDPNGQHSENTAYYPEEGILRLLIPTRDYIVGNMYCKCYTRKADEDFDDGIWDICTKTERINIKLVE